MYNKLNMSLIIFSVIFWVIAAITILLKSRESLKTKTGLIKIVKPIPALAAAVFTIYMNLPSPALFYLLLAIALVLCALGDVGMEINILPGLGLFLFSHIFYTSNFFFQSLTLGLTIIPLTAFGVCLVIMIGYIFFYQRYLKTTQKEVEPALLKAVNVYALMISLTLSTALLLWFSSEIMLGFIPLIGAIFFVLSDSIIGIREFHHDIKNAELIILSTYYLAIFLLSLGAILYTF
ncbi:lysoplasmalogenase [Candidatus Thorarchaeota archaeon]|nr:MAG: lysoplasmalogenase [Candidatus Thorarchaeota archaeon]